MDYGVETGNEMYLCKGGFETLPYMTHKNIFRYVIL